MRRRRSLLTPQLTDWVLLEGSAVNPARPSRTTFATKEGAMARMSHRLQRLGGGKTVVVSLDGRRVEWSRGGIPRGWFEVRPLAAEPGKSHRALADNDPSKDAAGRRTAETALVGQLPPAGPAGPESPLPLGAAGRQARRTLPAGVLVGGRREVPTPLERLFDLPGDIAAGGPIDATITYSLAALIGVLFVASVVYQVGLRLGWWLAS